ncbi:MAG: glucuronide permease, partial [Streptococcus sp.]
MLTSMILGILTIVLALAFSLLHLAAAFSAMKQKNYSL